MKIIDYIFALFSIIIAGVAVILTAPISAYVYAKENKKLKKATKLKEKLSGDNIHA